MEHTTEQTAPGVPAGPGVVTTAVQAFGTRLSARFDQVDAVVLLGLVLLVAGLWLWWSLGVALTVAGALVLAVGFMGAAAKGRPADEAAPAGVRGG